METALPPPSGRAGMRTMLRVRAMQQRRWVRTWRARPCRSGGARAGSVVLTLALPLALLGPAAAAPADLANPEPRWISMQVESSGPAASDRRYAEAVPAWLQPGPAPGQVMLSVPAQYVESVIFAQESPVPGSFSDFVWVFDQASGHVLRAGVTGRMLQQLDWGLATTTAEVEVHVQLDTLRAAGYSRPRSVFGRPVQRFCTRRDGCTPVEAVPYRASTGYVNAVGGACARWHGLRSYAFAPIGEVRLSERSGQPDPALRAPLLRLETVRSRLADTGPASPALHELDGCS